MTDRQLMQQALDALENIAEFAVGEGDVCEIIAKRARLAITVLRERLAQPEQEPVAWMHTMIDDVVIGHRPADLNRHPERWKPLYTNPLAAERNKLAAWMMAQGYATGHGDATDDLLKELEWQVRESEREACAKWYENAGWLLDESDVADAIRART